MSAHHQTVLSTAVHCLRIYIIIWLLVLHQPSLVLPCLEVLDSLVICRLAVLVNDRIKVNFRLSYMQKRFFTGLCLGFH